MSAGEMAAIMMVLLLPPKAFFSNWVRTESRKGTFFFFLWPGSLL